MMVAKTIENAASLQLRGIEKKYGNVAVLKGIDISADEGEFVVLLGPSGCGKSTLLNAIAGLQSIDSGSILIQGREVTQLPTRERDIAMVFQSYALYPTMTVAQNMAFPLRMRKRSSGDIARAVEEVAKLLQIENLLARLPRELSGGQRQRVAIGRALVRDPCIFLFDEPLSNLDATLRFETRSEIKRLHARLGKTMVYVTHDQIEAMTLATRIVVMLHGCVQQIGTPWQVYHQPANLFVARFVGTPTMQMLAGTLQNCAQGVQWVADRGIALTVTGLQPNVWAKGQSVLLGFRPEHVHLTDAPDGWSATVVSVEPTGPEDNVILDFHGQQLVARWPTNSVAVGAQAKIQLDCAKASIFDAESSLRLN